MQRFPIDVLGLDRSFIAALGDRDDSQPVIAAIINMARGLEVDVVAEGIETPARPNVCRASGVNGPRGICTQPPYDAIHRVDPRASVLLGGISNLTGATWLRQVFATPGPNAARHFDIANVHLRGRLTAMGPDVRRWRAFFARDGFGGPLWITEHGYPADPAYQWDPAIDRGRFRRLDTWSARYRTSSTPAPRRCSSPNVTCRSSAPSQQKRLLSGVSDPNSTVIQPVQRPAFASLAALSASLARPTTARPRDNARPSRVGERRPARSDAVLCPPSDISGLFGDLGG